MPRDYSTLTGPSLLPMVDTPERQRFSFWWPHATPIQASLLQLTDWLGENPDRPVPVVGQAEPVRALNVRPNESVLFRLEKPGTRERADWEWYFLTVRRVQAHGRLVRQKLGEARARRTQVDSRVAELQRETDTRTREAEKERDEFVRRVGQLEAAARAERAESQKKGKLPVRTVEVPAGVLGTPGAAPLVFECEDDTEAVPGPPTSHGPAYRELLAARDEGRALGGRWAGIWQNLARRRENLERERAPVEQRLRWLEERATRRVFPGLFATINAFLDVQALSAASVAIEEFRKSPRRESALADELEARLAADRP
ncbi:MAG TPA: hypothetical protein VGV89_08175 [Thermoplasmata archaeon]|nr:hypothetical protein [Thermoplasmata archaeon]